MLTCVMNRLTVISSWNVQIPGLIRQQHEMRGILLSQQRELAEVRELLKALDQVQNVAAKNQRSTCR